MSAAPVIPLALASRDDTPGTAPTQSPFLRSAHADTGGFGEFVRFVGQLGYSADGLGQAGPGGTADAEIPTGATVEKAFLYGSYFGTTSPNEQQRTIRLAGRDVLLQTIPSGAGSFLSAARADITDLVTASVAGRSGRFGFPVQNDPSGLDGVALLVIYQDSTLPQSTIAVVDGGAAQAGQRTVLRFSSPIDKDAPTFQARMSLGIGFGFQGAPGHTCGPVAQGSLVIVNGDPLSGCAGGYDDGIGANGGLITVGGVDDSLDNPSDPRQLPGDGRQPRVIDDELYDLGPFIADGDNQLVVETANPSFDDILFLTVINVSAKVAAVTSVPIEQTFGAGSGLHAINPTGFLSDPVNTLSGSFVTGATDMVDRSPLGGLELARFYNSADDRSAAFGRGWSHTLGTRLLPEGDGAVVLVAEDGQRVRYEANGGDSFIPPPGGRSVLTRAASGYRLVRPDGVAYDFDERGLLAAFTTAQGGRVNVGHDADGHLLSARDAAGRSLRFTSDQAGRVTAVTSSDGRTVSYGYVGDRLTTVTDTRGGTTRFTHDDASRIVSVTDANGNLDVRNAYDSRGRVVSQTDALEEVSTFAWDDAAQTVTMTDALGRRYTDFYSDGVLIKGVDGAGHTQEFTRDAELRITSFTDPSGARFTVSYDDRGNVAAVTGPDGARFTIQRDSASRPTSIVDAASVVVRLSYDALGRLSTVEDAGGATSVERAETAPPSSLTDAAGATTTFERDASGALTAFRTPEGRRTQLSYTADGLLESVVDARGAAPDQADAFRSSLVWDTAGNLLEQLDPLGNAVRRAYDAVGNLLSVTDGSGTTRYTYDAADRLTEVHSSDGSTTGYAYDGVGSLLTRTDARGGITRYAYDQANQLVEQTSPTGQRWSYTYDAVGNVTSIETPAGAATPQPGDGTTTYSYDLARRLLSVQHSDDTPDVTFTYDSNGRRATMSDGQGVTRYSYNELGSVTEVQRNDETISYTYDQVGRITSRTYPDGRAVGYTWTADGDLQTVTEGGKSTQYRHDAAGNLTHITHANGTVEEREYDQAGRVTATLLTRNGKVTRGERLELDGNGNPLTITETVGGGIARVRSFAYDDQDRLISECFSSSCRIGAGNASVTYQYDALGNRIKEQRPGKTVHYSYDAANQLVSSTDGREETLYEHDVAGNLVRAGDERYIYDLENRMVESINTRTGETTRYLRDGEGNVVRREGVDSGDLLWDPNANVPLLAEETGAAGTTAYTWAHALLTVAGPGKKAPLNVHTDRLGSVIAATDDKGAPALSREYTGFGEIRQSAGPSNDVVRFGFAGTYRQPTVDVVDQRARAYHPALGRFLQRDPLAAPLTDPYTASYLYVGNRPTVATDPSGLFCVFGKSSNGSCRGSGVVESVTSAAGSSASAVADAASATARFVVDNRYAIGGVAVAGACVAAGIFTAFVATAACYAGAGVLFGGQAVEAGINASRGPGFAFRQFFADTGRAAFLTWATMIPGLGINALALKSFGFSFAERFFVSTAANLPAFFCAVFCPTVTVNPRRSAYGFGSK